MSGLMLQEEAALVAVVCCHSPFGLLLSVQMEEASDLVLHLIA